MMKKKLQRLAMAVPFAMVSMAGQAGTSVTAAFTSGTNQWSDDSGEILVDNNSNGILDTGDYLVGVLGITSFPTTGVDPSTVNELTAIFATEVKSTTDLSGSAAFSCGSAAITSCTGYEFGTTGDFNAAIAAANAVLGGALTIGPYTNVTSDTVAMFLEDDGTSFNRDGGSIADAFNTGGDGVERLAVDLIAANGDTWTGTGPSDLTQFGLVPSGQGIGFFSIDGTISYEGWANITLNDNITANGSVKPTDGSSFTITDDATFEVTMVPEPTVLGLMGLGLLGLGGMARRRRG